MFVTVVDPIKKQKKELEDERLPEFAPPASYFKSEKLTSSKQSFVPPTIYNDSVYNPVNATFDHTGNSYQLPPLFSHPIPPTFSDSVTEIAAGIRRNTVERIFDNPIDDRNNKSDLVNSSVQESDNSIRESVTEVLRYYKSKSALHE